MRPDNWLFLESLFITKFGNILPELVDCLARNELPNGLLREHLKKVESLLGESLDIEWQTFGTFLLRNQNLLRTRAADVTKNLRSKDEIPPNIDALEEAELADVTDEMSEEQKAAYDKDLKQASERFADKIASSEIRSKNAQKGNIIREQDARTRVQAALQRLRVRGEQVSVSSVAREGKMSETTVRKHKDLLNN
jgi:hypothetical protein